MKTLDPGGRLGIELDEGETMIMDGWANHFIGSVGDSGHLYLTSRRLIFRAHRVNLFGQSGALPVPEITELAPGRVPTELTVVMADGSRHKLAVWYRRRWIRAIEAARAGKEPSA
jgi:hypothetical protein